MRQAPRPRLAQGFTLTELVVVIAVVLALSAVAFVRLSNPFAATRGFYDQVFAQVTYARKLAIAQRRPVFVRIDGVNSRLCYSAAGACTGGDAVAGPTGPAPMTVAIPAGVAITAGTFQFDALGRYLLAGGGTPPGTLAITVTGDGTHTLFVEPQTGYVHP